MPDTTKTWLRSKFSQSKLVNRLGWASEYAPEFLLTLLIMYGSLVGFLIVLRLFLLAFLSMSSGLSHLAVLAVGIGLPITLVGKMYIYDFSQLLLFTAGLILLFQQRWHWFYPIYALACINKETSILLPVVLFCWLGLKALRPPYRWHLLSQALIGFGICYVIGYIFQNNPGGTLEWHLHRNISMSISTLGKFRVVVLIFAITLSLWKFSRAPLFLRRGLAATLPVLMCTAFFFGYFDELRNYYEALPFIIGLILLTIGGRIGIRPRFASGGDEE